MAVAQASLLQSFPFRAAVFVACVLLLPLFPSPQAPAGLDGRGEKFLAKVWELLHLLVVGIAVSYGLFSRRNDAGRRGDDKDIAAAAQAKADAAGYVSQMLHDSLVFDDGGGDVVLDSPGVEGAKVRSWSAMHRPDEPVVVVAATGGGGRSHAAEAQHQAPLSLPVRTLKPQGESSDGEPWAARPRRSSQDMPGVGGGSAHETVLPSPIPWRSRSGRFDASAPSPSPSPKRLSPASSLSKETLAKASEDYSRRRSPYKSSPPAPPPPPPPFLVHGYHPPAAERRTAAKSFKEELQEQTSHSFSTSGYSRSSSNSSSAKPRRSIDGSSSSSYYPVGKSVRTIRAREAVQSQSQDQPAVAVAGDAPGLHGSDSDDTYGGYRAYQSIPRFQYERGSSDPILGNVTVSSESSDDEDDDGDGEFSTRGNSPRRESTPEVDENEVDKKAEEFIARFREQIRLQRIESIKKSAGPRGVKHGK
ncbi:hypothetical protein E2562_006157 [Oryza meyeriana var. granulata]|uniref:DUF4408 domain-containing protein n=1 Tax=Oryza meyeriana var. granulata TaxID=110450 RepID=A0A6G1EVQ4_9ORYZ|nr:hypothetical protein E2562_006157 [Oryza meyeriana var. granulata]